MDDEKLLQDLADAGRANIHGRECQVCESLLSMSDNARIAVEAALAGKIGVQKLSDILIANGYEVGRRAVSKHRLEGHAS